MGGQRRRPFLSWTLSLALSGIPLGAVAYAPAASADPETIVANGPFNREAEIGTITKTTRRNTALNRNESILVTVSSSIGGMLSAVNLTTGKNVLAQQLATDGLTRSSRAMVTMPNGDVFVASTLGELYRLDPEPDTPTLTEVPKLADAFPDARATSVGGVLTILTATPSVRGDRVYVGTSNGRVYAFDIAAWQKGLAPWRDLGRVSSSPIASSPLNNNLYVNSITTYRNGWGQEIMFAGVGSAQPGLWRKDLTNDANPWTGKLITDSAGLNGAGNVTLVAALGNYLYVSYAASGSATHVQRLSDGAWVDKENPMWIVGPGPAGSGDVVTTRIGSGTYARLASYDPTTAQPGREDRKILSATTIGEIPRGDCWLSPTSCVTYAPDGTLFLADPTTKAVNQVGPDTSLIAAGTKNTSQLGLGPDDRVYVSSDFFSKEIVRLPKAGTGDIEYIPNGPAGTNGQVESMQSVDDKLVIGTYRPAQLSTFTTGAPASRTLATANPTATTTLVSPASGSALQSRPKSTTNLGNGIVAVGTMPEYGVSGGSVVLYDTTTNKTLAINHGDGDKGVVPNQSILTLTNKGGVIYGGSTIEQGWGMPVATQAQIFTMNYSAPGALTTGQSISLPGIKSVFGITFTTTGKLYALVCATEGHIRLLRLDPATLAILSDDMIKWRGHMGVLRPLTNGGLAVTGSTDIMAIDTNGPKIAITQVASGIYPVVDSAGNWFYGRVGTGNVYMTNPGLPFRGIPSGMP
jgi:hypothetical protein